LKLKEKTSRRRYRISVDTKWAEAIIVMGVRIMSLVIKGSIPESHDIKKAINRKLKQFQGLAAAIRG